MNLFKFKTMAKDINKRKTELNRNKREREKDLPDAYLRPTHLVAQQNRPSPPLQPLRRLPPLAPKQLRARRAGESRQLLLACLATPSSPWSPPATPRNPPDALSLSLDLSPSSALPTESRRRRRSQPPRPQPLPRSLSASLSSVPTPWSCTPTHATRGGPSRPEHRRLHPRCPEIAAVNSPSQKLPRARRPLRSVHCEPLFLFPLLSSSRSSPSFFLHRGREFLAAGHGVAVATATTARFRAHCRAHRDLRSP